MSKKNQKTNTVDKGKKFGVLTNKSPSWKTIGTKVFGVSIITVSFATMVQILPLLFVFVGAYMGLQPNVSLGHIDAVIWALTCVSVLVVALYVYINCLKYVWLKMVWNTNHKR